MILIGGKLGHESGVSTLFTELMYSSVWAVIRAFSGSEDDVVCYFIVSVIISL